MKTALTIAGSDSGGGAGVQADLKTFAAHGVYGTSAITAITAQNTVGVMAVHALPPDLVAAQIEAVMGDIGADAAKTGMLLTAPIVRAVADAVERLGVPHLVVDPVMVAKSGDRLLEQDAIAALRDRLLPLAWVATPNLMEAEVLAEISIRNLDDAREAARRLHRLGPRAVVVTGGHLAGEDVVDVFYDGQECLTLRGPRLDGRAAHGTGCTFAAAVAAWLALGRSPAAAAAAAKEYVAQAMLHSAPIGHGHGPLNHFWRK